MEDIFGLTGRTAIVWGGGSGMGERCAWWLAQAGCDVAVVDLDGAAAREVAEQIEGLGRRAVALTANVTDEGEVDRAVADAEAALGGLSVMVTVVGMAGYRPLVDTTSEQWDREEAINVKSFFLTARAVARSMQAGGREGSITAVASTSGLVSAPNHAVYGAAKAALIHLVRSFAVELAPGIRVNAIAPGGTITQRVRPTPDRVSAMRRRVPARRLGTTDEQAKAVLFLASDMASYVTGHTLPVDGGWSSAFLFSPEDLQPTDSAIDWDAVVKS